VVDVPNEIAQVLGVAEGSIALLHANEGRLEVEICRRLLQSWSKSVRRINEKYKDAFEEMKRLGD